MTDQSDPPLGFCQSCGAKRIIVGQSHCASCGQNLLQPSEMTLGPVPAEVAAATQLAPKVQAVPAAPVAPAMPVAPAPAPAAIPMPEQPMAPPEPLAPAFLPASPPPASSTAPTAPPPWATTAPGDTAATPPAVHPPPPPPPAAPPSVPSAPAPDYGQQGQGQPPSPALDYTQPQGYGSAPGYGYGPAHVRRNSTPIFVGLGLVGLVAVIIAGALLFSSAGSPHATSAPSAIALATPTATPVPTLAPTAAPTSTAQIVYVTPVPTVAATPAGTSWEVLSDYETDQQALQLADTQAWNDANNPNTTYAAATKVRADRQADLAWLTANPPMDCYSILYNDLMLYDTQDIKAMDDWFAGRYDTVNNVDLPLVNATWNRISSELADGDAACA